MKYWKILIINDDEDTVVNFCENDIKLHEENQISNSEEKIENTITNENSKNKNEIMVNEKIIKQNIKFDSNEEKLSEKSERVQFIKSINVKNNKFQLDSDKNGSNNAFKDRPNIFNYSKINDSSEKTVKINYDKNPNEDNHNYFNNRKKNNIFDSSNLIKEDEQQK